MKRLLAGAGLIFFAACLILLLYLMISGAPGEQILAVLIVLAMITILTYALLMLAKLRDRDSDRSE